MGEPVFLDSAFRHDVAEADTLWALARPIRFFYNQGDLSLTIVTGLNRSGLVILEVGYTFNADHLLIYHSMPARTKFL